MGVMSFEEITLQKGAHGGEWCGEQCAVELSNLIAARKVLCPPELLSCDRLEPASRFGDDHPSISRVIRSYVIGLNDAWDDEQRQLLKPYAARILCTATGAEDEQTRAWLATDWLVRVHAPGFLRLAGLTEHAQALEGLARIADATIARASMPAIRAAQKSAAAAWDAAGDAAWAAARDAAGDAAGDAAWAAARAAAGAAARAAAGAALKPTVTELQASSLVLLDAMIAVGRPEVAAVA